VIRQPLFDVIAETLRVSTNELTLDSGIDKTRNWDSLKHMEVLLNIEARFEIIFDIDELGTLTTIAQIQNSLISKKC
jgi:acyl carrier protein